MILRQGGGEAKRGKWGFELGRRVGWLVGRRRAGCCGLLGQFHVGLIGTWRAESKNRRRDSKRRQPGYVYEWSRMLVFRALSGFGSIAGAQWSLERELALSSASLGQVRYLIARVAGGPCTVPWLGLVWLDASKRPMTVGHHSVRDRVSSDAAQCCYHATRLARQPPNPFWLMCRTLNPSSLWNPRVCSAWYSLEIAHACERLRIRGNRPCVYAGSASSQLLVPLLLLNNRPLATNV